MASVLLQKTPYGSFGSQPGGTLAKYQGKDLSSSVMDKEEELPMTAEELARSLAEKDALQPPMLGPISIDPTDWLTPGGLAKVAAVLKGVLAPAAATSAAMLVGSRAAGPASLLARTVGEDQAGVMSRPAFLAKNPEFANTIFKTEEGLIKELYHGTSKDKDFKTFARNRRGNFVGESPKEASSYAMGNDSMGYTQDGYKLTPKNTASQVKPVFVNVQSPYYLEGEELVAYVRSSNYAKTQREIMDRAKALGHDAVIYPDGGIAVKDPSQIKSSLTGD